MHLFLDESAQVPCAIVWAVAGSNGHPYRRAYPQSGGSGVYTDARFGVDTPARHRGALEGAHAS